MIKIGTAVAPQDILVLEDDPDSLATLQELLSYAGHRALGARTVEEAIAEIDRAPPALALLDLWVGAQPEGGLRVLTHMQRQCPHAPAIMISAHGDVASVVRSMQLGAFTFLEKPASVTQIREVVLRGLQYREQLIETTRLRPGAFPGHGLLGTSSAITGLRKEIARVAVTNARVLFVGAEGSGREEAARFLHRSSRRADRPFFRVEADADVSPFARDVEEFWPPLDVLRCANGGTLLIGRIESLSAERQSGLRRLVSSRDGPLDMHGKSRIDVRVLSSSDGGIEGRVGQGRFSRDLYERLAVKVFRIPELRDRLADMEALACHFARQRAEERGWAAPTFAPDAVQALQQQRWPGNLVELQEAVRDIVDAVSDDACAEAPAIDAEALPHRYRPRIPRAPQASLDIAALADLPVKEARNLFERQYFLELVKRTDASMPEVARRSGMERTALYRKMHSIGISQGMLESYRNGTAAAAEALDPAESGQE